MIKWRKNLFLMGKRRDKKLTEKSMVPKVKLSNHCLLSSTKKIRTQISYADVYIEVSGECFYKNRLILIKS